MQAGPENVSVCYCQKTNLLWMYSHGSREVSSYYNLGVWPELNFEPLPEGVIVAPSTFRACTSEAILTKKAYSFPETNPKKSKSCPTTRDSMLLSNPPFVDCSVPPPLSGCFGVILIGI